MNNIGDLLNHSVKMADAPVRLYTNKPFTMLKLASASLLFYWVVIAVVAFLAQPPSLLLVVTTTLWLFLATSYISLHTQTDGFQSATKEHRTAITLYAALALAFSMAFLLAFIAFCLAVFVTVRTLMLVLINSNNSRY